MIPILSDSATLQGNGLGGLSDAIECVVTDEVNGEYELRMRYPVTGEHYAEIQNNLIIFAEPMALASAQPFRIYRITKPLNGVVTIYARHLAYDMSGIVVKPFSALSLTAALSAVPTYSVPSCPFTLTSTRTITSKMEIDEPRPLWTLLGGSAGSFLDVYGGEWEFNGYTATLKTKLGEDRGVVIRYGKNLTELENDSDLSSTYGGVFPYWYDEEEGLVTITEGYVPVTGSIFTRILLLDCSSDFDEKPTEAQLRTKAQNYIDNNSVGSPKDSWKVSFAQLAQAGEYETQALLEEVQLGDTVSVIYEALGVNASARVVKTEWDVLGEKYKAVTIGRVKQNLASILVGQNKETERAISQTKSALERAIASSTDFIKNGTGVMRFIYNADGDLMEIVSLDNADLSQAQSVWRWNQGGFGHSSTGYNGTYTTAITQDGQIVADFITAGTLSGNRVRTGLIEDEAGNNSWNLDTGEFHSQTLENAISQTEEGISLVSQKLNNIGGRNILRNSATAHWVPLNSPTVTFEDGVTVTEWGTNEAMRAYGTGGSTRAALQFLNVTQTSAIYLANTTYTMSVYLKNNHQTNAISLGCNGSLEDVIVEPGEAKRVSLSIQGDGSTALRMYIRTPSPGDAFDFAWWHPQIEYGEVVTSWNPAPEDVEGAIAANSAAIEVNATNIELKVSQTDYNGNTIASLINQTSTSVQIQASKIDLQGYVTFSNLSTSGQTSINGANLTTGLIQDQAGKNSWNLNTGALTITDGTININSGSDLSSRITFTAENTPNNPGTYHIGIYPYQIYSQFVGDSNYINTAGIAGEAPDVWAVYTDRTNNSQNSGTLSPNSVSIRKTGANYAQQSESKLFSNLFAMYGTSTSAYSALIWPDSNGAGRLVLGDGSSTLWRTSLTNDGLTFRDSSNNVTASYPADGLIKSARTTAANYTIGNAGYVQVTKPAACQGKTIISTEVRSWSSNTGAFSVTGYNANATTTYIMGTPGATIIGLVIEFFYID